MQFEKVINIYIINPFNVVNKFENLYQINPLLIFLHPVVCIMIFIVYLLQLFTAHIGLRMLRYTFHGKTIILDIRLYIRLYIGYTCVLRLLESINQRIYIYM